MSELVAVTLAFGTVENESTITVREKRTELAKVNAETQMLTQMQVDREIDLESFRRLNSGSAERRRALEAEIVALVRRDAVAALVDGLTLGSQFTDLKGETRSLRAYQVGDAQTIRERFNALPTDQKRTVVNGLFGSITLERASGAGRQSQEAVSKRIVVSRAS